MTEQEKKDREALQLKYLNDKINYLPSYALVVANGKTLWRIKVVYDEDPWNPREDVDACLGRMRCWHRNYDLSDKEAADEDTIVEHSDDPDWFIMPVYIYDHSGITLSAGPFGDPWDSGQVGLMYTTRGIWEKLKMKPWPEDKKEVREALVAELNEFDRYVRGDYYCVFADKWDPASPFETPDIKDKTQWVNDFDVIGSVPPEDEDLIGPIGDMIGDPWWEPYDPEKLDIIQKGFTTYKTGCWVCAGRGELTLIKRESGKWEGSCDHCKTKISIPDDALPHKAALVQGPTEKSDEA